MPSGVMCVIILAFSAFISGVSGFGFSMVALTLFSLLFDIKTSVVFLAAHTLACNIFQLVKLRKHLSFTRMLPLIAGALSGVPAGAYLLKNIDPWWIKKALGLVIIIFVLQQVIYRKEQKNGGIPPDAPGAGGTSAPARTCEAKNTKKTLAGLLAGAAGGALMGGLLSGGPPIMIYALKESSDKYYIKSTLQSFFFFTSLYAIIIYLASGLMTAPLLMSSLLYLPATIAGTGLGILVFEKLSVSAFNKIVLILITILGISMLFK
ncbi:MAG: sulfite exporter TauE/SafE family protein [Bacillota bacterium]